MTQNSGTESAKLGYNLHPQTFTLTLSSQDRLYNSISWPKVQKSGITWPGVLFV